MLAKMEKMGGIFPGKHPEIQDAEKIRGMQPNFRKKMMSISAQRCLSITP
jgi:hypothetical protein